MKQQELFPNCLPQPVESDGSAVGLYRPPLGVDIPKGSVIWQKLQYQGRWEGSLPLPKQLSPKWHGHRGLLRLEREVCKKLSMRWKRISTSFATRYGLPYWYKTTWRKVR